MGAVWVGGADETVNSGAVANSLIILADFGRLFSLTVYNNGPDQWIQLFDSLTVPAEATVPKLVMLVPANSQGSFDYATGRMFTTGMVVCNSTTAVTKTIGAANCIFDATFRRRV